MYIIHILNHYFNFQKNIFIFMNLIKIFIYIFFFIKNQRFKKELLYIDATNTFPIDYKIYLTI